MKAANAIQSANSLRENEAGAMLIVKRSGETLVRYPLRGERTIIGRSTESDLGISSKYISWNHAAIDFDQDRAFIVDLGSRNGTMVNGEIIKKSYLSNRDVITLGNHRIEYRSPVRDKQVSECLGGSVNTSADAFRAFVDTIHQDPDMLVADLDTKPIDNDELPLMPVEQRLVDVEPVEELQREEFKTTELENDISAQFAERDVTIEQEAVEAAIVAAEGSATEIIESLHETFEHQELALTRALAKIFDFETMTSNELMQLSPDFDVVDLTSARDRQCLIVTDAGEPVAVICNPFDQDIRPWLESRFPETLRWVLVAPGDVLAYISRHEQSMNAMDSAISVAAGADENGNEIEGLSLASISQDSSPVVKLVHSTLYDALKAGASDIHMESGNAALEIRYRIDGVLAHVATVSGKDVAEQVISRIKVMSELDIAERRIPQDGRFKSAYEGRPIDFRVSIMPSSFGEDAVLRVLDKQAVTDQMTDLSLDSLGFADELVGSLRKLSERPYGMLLVTGPTGSGKTTTLYGAISETNSGLGKIVTIEDPVEYQLPGVLQIPVNEKKGLTFARGLRSILRHDPDKIMVGEIRDPETAQIAIQSALTGHLVFTTVHANNVFDVLSRFLHMGVDAYSFVSALNGILAQRLLRIICHGCGTDIRPSAEMLKSTGEPIEVARQYNWRAGQGCGECRGTGYRGRKAIGELLVLNDELREAIIGRVPVRQLKELAQKGGVKFIRTSALNLVRDGLTTMEEVDRVTTMA